MIAVLEGNWKLKRDLRDPRDERGWRRCMRVKLLAFIATASHMQTYACGHHFCFKSL